MPFILPVPPALSITSLTTSCSSSINVLTVLCFLVDISPAKSTLPSRSTMPYLVPVPPISIPIASWVTEAGVIWAAFFLAIENILYGDYIICFWLHLKHLREKFPMVLDPHQPWFHNRCPVFSKYLLRQIQKRPGKRSK